MTRPIRFRQAKIERLRCSVPFCGRTTGEPFTEWVCGNHWRLVPKRLRRLYALAKRRRKPSHVLDWLWQRCKVSAIEAAGGIA